MRHLTSLICNSEVNIYALPGKSLKKNMGVLCKVNTNWYILEYIHFAVWYNGGHIHGVWPFLMTVTVVCGFLLYGFERCMAISPTGITCLLSGWPCIRTVKSSCELQLGIKDTSNL